MGVYCPVSGKRGRLWILLFYETSPHTRNIYYVEVFYTTHIICIPSDEKQEEKIGRGNCVLKNNKVSLVVLDIPIVHTNHITTVVGEKGYELFIKKRTKTKVWEMKFT